MRKTGFYSSSNPEVNDLIGGILNADGRESEEARSAYLPIFCLIRVRPLESAATL
jgi:hypothetical protein